MRPPDRSEPTADQLLAMAYVDDELAEFKLREFRAKQLRDPELLREVVELQALDVFIRGALTADPHAFERARLSAGRSTARP